MLGGALLALVRNWPSLIWSFIKRQSMVVIDITDKDQAFQWLTLWLANHEYSKNQARLLTIKTEHDKQYRRPEIIFSPAPGTHWLFYKGRLMILSRQRQQMGQGQLEAFREYFTIKILGRNRAVSFQLINDAYDLACPSTVDKVAVHRAGNYGWSLSSWIPKRNIESVILQPGIMPKLVKDIENFRHSESYYTDRGIPYRRGYLFYGPPGNGKTSAVIALAAKFQMDIGVINLKSDSLEDLAGIIAGTPPGTLILLEDIDCVVSGRKTKSSVSFSGLLNAIDGLSAGHGQIIMMTTNYREKLDDALIRPGRCDVQMEFPNADSNTAELMFERFFPGSGFAHEFSNRVPCETSMATLQKHLMQHKDSPRAAFDTPINKDILDESETAKEGTGT